jgi:hypothetical protein
VARIGYRVPRAGRSPAKDLKTMRTILPAMGLLVSILPSQDVADAKPADYQFQSRSLHLDGVSRLSDLRGRPVLIEFWGRR